MRYPFWLLLVCAGCAARMAPPAGSLPASVAAAPAATEAPRVEASAAPPGSSPASSGAGAAAQEPVVAPTVVASNPAAPTTVAAPTGSAGAVPGTVVVDAAAGSAVAAAVETPGPGCAVTEADDEGDSEGEETAEAADVDDGESESAEAVAGTPAPDGPLYTTDLSDEELTRRWKDEPASLGSISAGFANSGRMVNSKQFPKGDEWIVVSPELAYATEESVNYLVAAIKDVRARFPNAPQLRVNQMSSKDGGYMRPHKSHQNGRDVDVGFYYPTVDPIRERAREHYIDTALSWALLRSIIVNTDVQLILVDRRVQKVLYDQALRNGEDKAWLDSLFNEGPNGLIKHARGHRDHFHFRFYNPRAQELGRRVAPLLALQPDQNLLMHRVRNGDTLGAIALRYNSGVSLIKKANRMRNTFLRIGQVLAVPLRGPCTRCPVPPPVVVPARRLPPELAAPPAVAQQAPCPTPPNAQAAVPAAPSAAGLTNAR